VFNFRCRATPEIYALKRMLSLFQQDREVIMYCDLHGHSKMFNCFIYGCDPTSSDDSAKVRLPRRYCRLLQSQSDHSVRAKLVLGRQGRINYGVRLLPYRLSQAEPSFSYHDCSFEMEKYKESTGRVVVYR
jgi:hypothetical protein